MRGSSMLPPQPQINGETLVKRLVFSWWVKERGTNFSSHGFHQWSLFLTGKDKHLLSAVHYFGAALPAPKGTLP